MRLYEWISLVFFAGFALLGTVRPLPTYQRLVVMAIAVAGIGGIILVRHTAFRNWLPVALMPMAYWQTGQFTRPIHQAFQSMLESFDRRYLRLGQTRYMWLLEMGRAHV